LRVNQAQRIELPVYFNTPKRREDIIAKQRLTDKSENLNNQMLTDNSGL